ncbi:hypothetical protein GCM10009765_32620 [Fodinicola feengrottensis]|uniref:XRE family transcriptional regulator n=1 Tax=Fodinicola feengrottensis TaxID=435914 RepID=A0ABN2H3F2_9ACTN
MQQHTGDQLSGDLPRTWRRWEAGTEPRKYYKALIAATFETVTDAIFGNPAGAALSTGAEPDTLELITSVRRSDLDAASLETLGITVDRLCSAYRSSDPVSLRQEARDWLRRLTALLESRLSLTQHREILVQAGWLALLVSCLENDLCMSGAAEATRRAALSLGDEAAHPEIVGWAYEIAAWQSLTAGDYRAVLATADRGLSATQTSGAAVQLHGQRAKAFGRLGDADGVRQALEASRRLIESLPYPTNTAHHFAVDPNKWNFYAADTYRCLGHTQLANQYANEVIAASTAPDGTVLAPMRIAEVRVSLGILAARDGDLDRAHAQGMAALNIERQSLPSLRLVAYELAGELEARFSGHTLSRDYRARLRSL